MSASVSDTYDSAHLPECPLLEPCDDEVPDHGYCSMQHGVFCIHCQQWCICDRLRACEQRVKEESARGFAPFLITSPINHDILCRISYDAGLDAEREAVQGLDCPECSVDAALAAIDAFREAP